MEKSGCICILLKLLGVAKSKGIIVVDPDSRSKLGSIIAHEWRHHYQYFHGPYERGPSWYYLKDKYTYKEAVVKYFTLSHIEMDALIFSRKHIKDEHDEVWVEWIIKFLG